MKKSFRILLIVAVVLVCGLLAEVMTIPRCDDVSQIHYMTYHFVSSNNFAEYDNGIATGQFSGAFSLPNTWTYNSFSNDGFCRADD